MRVYENRKGGGKKRRGKRKKQKIARQTDKDRNVTQKVRAEREIKTKEINEKAKKIAFHILRTKTDFQCLSA
jgi:hypothetical protein